MSHLYLREGDPYCPPDWKYCGNTCVPLSTSVYNCGGCGNGPCEIAPTNGSALACQNSTCHIIPTCPPELPPCGGICFDLSSDSSNCGICGKVCPPSGKYNPGPCWDNTCVSSYPDSSPNSSVSATTSTGSTGTFTTAANTSATTSSHASPPSPNVSTGVAAGIGVGCAIAGALLAGLVAVFILFRRNRPQTRDQHPVPLSDNMGGYTREEKSGVTTTTTNMKYLVPQPAEDDVMSSDLFSISVGIKDHVQSFYHTAEDKHQMVDEGRLEQLSRATAIPTRDIVGLLQNSRTRIPMLRLFLAHFILSRSTEQSDVTQSFLPSEVLAFERLNVTDHSSTANQITLMSKWKAISGTLLEQQYSEVPTGNDPRLARIEEALDASEPVLHPFINNVDANTRRNNLREVMKLAAQYAFVMFSQPCSYRFDYTRTGNPDTLVVFPALMITVNHEGQKLSPPKVLRKKEVVGLGRY